MVEVFQRLSDDRLSSGSTKVKRELVYEVIVTTRRNIADLNALTKLIKHDLIFFFTPVLLVKISVLSLILGRVHYFGHKLGVGSNAQVEIRIVDGVFKS